MQRFEAAVAFVRDLPSGGDDGGPDNATKLRLYGLFKVQEGKPIGSRPGIWSVVARAKHDAFAQQLERG
jgi:acyl-CoA-binding protein